MVTVFQDRVTEAEAGKEPGEYADSFWPFCGYGNVALLRTGEAQPLVHTGLCRFMRDGISLRISSGSVAVRLSGVRVVVSSYAALVS